jgi:hypothetical protein
MSKKLSNKEVQDILHSLQAGRKAGKGQSTGGGGMEGLERVVGGAQAKKAKSYEKLGKKYAKEIMGAESDIVGGGFWGDFQRGFNSVVKPVAKAVKIVAPIIPHPAGQVAPAVLSAVGLGKKPKKTRTLSEKQRKRNALVSKLMKQEGMTLPQASKHIKANNLV